MIPGRACAAALALIIAAQAAAEPAARIAIIIDDLGYGLEAGERTIALPGPVACAILPDAPRSTALATAANEHGKEVLLHLPLQAVNYDGPIEPGAIMLDTSREGLSQTVSQAFESVPFAVGVNGHRGSLITRHPGHMRWLMEDLRQRDGLFFVDSYTTHLSVAMQIARETGVRAIRRDVFLDPDAEPGTVEREFERLKLLARERGSAVAIGHPHPLTLEFLERELPGLVEDGIELVRLSELIEPPR